MDLLTTKEVANLLGVSMRQVQALITSGRLPAQKYGSQAVATLKQAC
jgi:excisionase family DNA binding protein